jgi:hypothetical protein
MPWRFTLTVNDASGNAVKGSRLELSTWNGAVFDVRAPSTIDDVHAFVVPDIALKVVLSLKPARYAPMSVNLVRAPGEPTWRWVESRHQVITAGQDVTIRAVPLRIDFPTTQHVPEDQLKRWAEQTKGASDARAREQKKTPVEAVRIQNLSGVLLDKNRMYRTWWTPDVPSFHLMAPECLGDPGTPGWGRFKSKTVNVQTMRRSRVHLIEYGEVGTNGPRAPRFLVAIWLPNQLAKGWRAAIDFMVWFSPQTKPPHYPVAQYPFSGSDYPFVLMAIDSFPKDPKEPYVASQRYATLAFSHLALVQHALALQMLAANRAAAIVVPIAPSPGQSQLWGSPQNLMRMLKEICRWIPRDDDGPPKFHLPPPVVGRVGVSGFSAAGLELNRLLDRPGPYSHYWDPVWGTTQDAQDFDRAWRELWAIDTNLGSELGSFAEKGALWSRHYDRRFRIYKNEFTDGPWDPRTIQSGEFGRAMRRAKHQVRGSFDKPLWAVSSAEPSGRIHAVSVSKAYVLEPTATEEPRMPATRWNEAHENMPRLFFGHGAATSGFAQLV